MRDYIRLNEKGQELSLYQEYSKWSTKWQTILFLLEILFVIMCSMFNYIDLKPLSYICILFLAICLIMQNNLKFDNYKKRKSIKL